MSKTGKANYKWIDNFMDKIQDRSVILKIIGIGLIIIFWDFLVNVYSSWIIQPILSKYVAHWSIDLTLLIFCLIFLAFFLYKIWKKEYKIFGNTLMYLLTALCISYSIVRFSDYGFKYYSIYFSKRILITDLIIMICSSIVIYSFFQIILSHKRSHTKNDEPLVDLFFRDKYAGALASLIKKRKGEKDSFAIGIIGKWGEGKTFFMNLTKKHLEKDNDCIIIDFNPWYSSSPKVLISDFFATLRNNLKKYNPDIASTFNSYARQLVKYYDKNNVLVSLYDSITNTPSSLKDQFVQVKIAIEKINKQIIICIDDLDRLDKEEIIEVIRLIRNTANFSNTVFLVTYDKAYVNSSIKDLNEYGSDTYLEKIFQQEVVLPTVDSSILKNDLISKISSNIGKDTRDWLESLINNDYSFCLLFDDFFKNFRDTYRFVNMYSLPFLQIKDDVHEVDFFNLQLLCFKYPEIYQLIKIDLSKRNPNFFNFENLFKANLITLKQTPEGIPINGANAHYTINIETQIKKIGYSDADSWIIMKLLNKLFPNKSKDEFLKKYSSNFKCIFYSINYKKYFAFRNLETNIPFSTLIERFTKTQKELNQQIEQWVLEGKHETLDVYFKSFDKFKSKEEYEKIINSMFYFANLINPERNRIINFNDNITREWISYKTAKDFYTDVNSHKSFILQVFKEAQTPALFPSGFISSEFSDWDDKLKIYGEMPFTKEEALELNNMYLKNYIEASSLFTVQVFWLYNYCNYPSIRSIEDANILMINMAKRDLENFLKIIVVQPNPADNMCELSFHILSIFGTYRKFEEFLNEVKTDEEYYKEFERFYNLTKDRNYSQIEFNINHLKKNKPKEQSEIILNFKD